MLESLRHAVSALPAEVTTKWLIILAGVAAVLIYLYFDNRKFVRYHQRLASHASTHDNQLLDYAIKLVSLSSRNRLLFALSIILLGFSVVFYDLKQVQKQHLAELEAAQMEKAQTEPAQPPKTVAAKPGDAALDEIKQRYEQAYVNFFVLYRCKLVDIDSLAFINSAFMLDMEKADVPANYMVDVRTAAQGTYKELYAALPCDDPSLKAMTDQHKAYILNIRALLTNNFNQFLTITP
ncbi:hypothetical protein GC177_07280 [bacterium]|nr:hypothetical protein [bacterium]